MAVGGCSLLAYAVKGGYGILFQHRKGKNSSYFAESENKLEKSTKNSVEMKIQDVVEEKEKTWKIVRIYKTQFSCSEAVGRLVKIHVNTKENVPCQRKK